MGAISSETFHSPAYHIIHHLLGRWPRSGWRWEPVQNFLLVSAQDQLKLPSITHGDGIGTYVTGCHWKLYNSAAALLTVNQFRDGTVSP